MSNTARKLDGHINRELEGKVILSVEKDTYRLIFSCTNGERWGISWVNDNGEALPGEPVLVPADKRLITPGTPQDGHIHRALQNWMIEFVRTDGRVLAIRVVAGGVAEGWGILWQTPEGEVVEGEPCLMKVDVVLAIPGVNAFGAANI